MDIRRFFNQKPPNLAGEGSSDVTLGESPGCRTRSSQDSDSTPESGAEASRSSCQGLKQGSSQVEAPGNLRVEKPNQVILKNFPARVFSGKTYHLISPRERQRSLVSVITLCTIDHHLN